MRTRLDFRREVDRIQLPSTKHRLVPVGGPIDPGPGGGLRRSDVAEPMAQTVHGCSDAAGTNGLDGGLMVGAESGSHI
jgi:hypothetical protein